MPKLSVLMMLFITALSSCVVGPNYYPPAEEEVPDEWHPAPMLDNDVYAEEPAYDWWKVFNDPLLSQCIALAANWNKDVHAAEANVRKAWAARAFEASYFYPQLALDINATRQAFSKNGPLFFLPAGINPNQTPSITIPRYQSLYNFLFDVNWEIDLFGKISRRVEAADARVGSAAENLDDVLLSVYAEVARNYIQIRSAQKRTSLIQQNIELIEKNAAIVKDRVQAGLDNNLNLERIEAEASALDAQLPEAVAAAYSGIYNLSILTGQLPEALLAEMLVPQPLPDIPCEIVIGLRSELLRRRPDVRKAERELAAATADIGVAVAEFFPAFTLSGDVGLQSVRLNNLFNWRSNLWSVGGDLLTPLFQGGRLKANLAMQEATAQEVAANYEKTVLIALQEAETALTSYTQDLIAFEKWLVNLKKNNNIVLLTEERYTKGLVNLTDLLDAQRQFISADQSILDSQTNALIDLIVLYKAIGGGWDCSDGNGL